MDEKSDEILEQIESQRDQLGANLNELENRVRQTADWRTHFDRNPMLMLGAALGGGIVLGAMVSGARSHQSGSPATPRYLSSSGSGTGTGNPTTSFQRLRASETIDHMKGALIAFATAKAREFMSEALPGFDSHLREAETQASSRASTYTQPGQGSQRAYSGTDYSSRPPAGQPDSSSDPERGGIGYGRPVAGQHNYSTEPEHAGTGGAS